MMQTLKPLLNPSECCHLSRRGEPERTAVAWSEPLTWVEKGEIDTPLDKRVAADTIYSLSIIDQQQWSECLCTPDLPEHASISAINRSWQLTLIYLPKNMK